MIKNRHLFSRCRGWLALVLVCLVLPVSPLQAQSDGLDQILELRKARREAAQDYQSNKSASSGPAQFGLLVIPVDFEDARLPSTWSAQANLATRVFGNDGHTLENFFNIASNGKMGLKTTIAPLVHLDGNRNSYSDIGWNGYSRTRALATEAISEVARLGIEFRRLDMDGPDGLPGSDDDDGQVDGVLILHAGVGQENDTVHGEIQALQFFIDPPVISGGVQASFYAVASLHSGLGIWAHETGHLLGMEDRYDPRLQPEAGLGDIRSLGGLGRFSLMSSGAWGTGQGQNPALPDAYSCMQLGWTNAVRYPISGNPLCRVSPWRNGGQPPVMAFSSGLINSEFFLMEARDPITSFPFDSGLPQGQMLIYHVDESVPEGWYVSDGGSDYHLRVRLVEADHDSALQLGTDDGRAEDSFPGPMMVSSFTPLSNPDSGGYGGPSGVSFTDITSDVNTVTFMVDDSPDDHSLDLAFQVLTESGGQLELTVQSLGNSISELTCTINLGGDGGGSFSGGELSYQFSLVESGGRWRPVHPVVFEMPENAVSGSATHFEFLFMADGVELPAISRPWVWLSDLSIFNFNSPAWVFWEQEFPNASTSTQWHLWNQPPSITADGSAVLACTGENFPSSIDWPNVQYGNRGRASISSPELGEDIKAIQLTHTLEVEHLHEGVVMDGATAFWQSPNGQLVEARPVDGWDAEISPQSENSLLGRPSFADSLMVLDEGDIPLWRCDVLPLPTTGGPWKLRLEFSSNLAWRWKGWFVAGMKPLDHVPESAFPVNWVLDGANGPSGLSWETPYPGSDYSNPVVEYYDPVTKSFATLPGQNGNIFVCSTGYELSRENILKHLKPGGMTRHILRVVLTGPKGRVASRSIVVYPDDGALPVSYLEKPFPNPSTGNIKFLVDIPDGKKGCLKIFDLRGRLVHSRDCQQGRYQVFWDGSDDQGRELSAGNYYLKLEGSGFSSVRKVVLIR